MKNNNYLEEWLSETRYLYMDVFDDRFSINFEKVTNGELVEKGIIEKLSDEAQKFFDFATSAAADGLIEKAGAVPVVR